MIDVTIDEDACFRCGTCTALCVSVFELDDLGKYAQITPKFRNKNKLTGKVPENKKCVKIAARKCPANAIKLVYNQ